MFPRRFLKVTKVTNVSRWFGPVRTSATSETPILDLELPFPAYPAKRSAFGKLAEGILVAIGIAAAMILFSFLWQTIPRVVIRMLPWAHTLHPEDDLGFIFLIALFLSWIPLLMIHEAGHAIVGWHAGFLLNEIRVGPFKLTRNNEKRWKFGWQRRADTGGTVRFHIDRVLRARKRLLACYLAGPAANIAVSILTISLAEIWGGLPYVLRSSLLVFGVLSLLVGMFNLIPFRLGSYMSDGMAVLMLRWQRREAIQYISVLALATLAKNGTVGKEFKRTWVQRAVSCRHHPYYWYLGNLYAFLFASAKEDYHSAARHLEECLRFASHLTPLVRNGLMDTACAMQAWVRNDPKKARVWLERIPVTTKDKTVQRIRLELMISVGQKDGETAQLLWEHGVGLLRGMPESDFRTKGLEAWFKWKEEIDQRLETVSFEAVRSPQI